MKVNGRDFQWEENLTVEGILEKKKYTFPKIIVKVNGELVSPEEYGTKVIMDGDDVKVIHLLAGG
ncbi:sulfur carrier protein ThiS [Alkaliphilus flagellatus]|uniref:sulfur carrier protein ThiS n=1 Tax=Alkaliphilus flagellatus TaxID=2841507 RepID=UPI0038CC00CE